MDSDGSAVTLADLIDGLADAVALRLGLAAMQAQRSPWLTTEEAAERLRCGPERVKKLRAAGELRYYREGRRCLHRIEDIDALMRPE